MGRFSRYFNAPPKFPSCSTQDTTSLDTRCNFEASQRGALTPLLELTLIIFHIYMWPEIRNVFKLASLKQPKKFVIQPIVQFFVLSCKSISQSCLFFRYSKHCGCSSSCKHTCIPCMNSHAHTLTNSSTHAPLLSVSKPTVEWSWAEQLLCPWQN